MAKHYFTTNEFELVKDMHEDGVDVTMEGLGHLNDGVSIALFNPKDL